MTDVRTLPLHHLTDLVSYFEPSQELSAQVKDASPAILVMTDLRQQIAVSIETGVSIDWALERMKTCGVRLLFVINSSKQVLGLITSTDILGEKPVQFRRELKLRREEIMVGDIMTSSQDLEVMHMDDVIRASVADVVETLKAAGRRHALVVDCDSRTNLQAIRGIFSLSQIGKQLDRLIDTAEVANTFAEVELMLNN